MSATHTLCSVPSSPQFFYTKMHKVTVCIQPDIISQLNSPQVTSIMSPVDYVIAYLLFVHTQPFANTPCDVHLSAYVHVVYRQ